MNSVEKKQEKKTSEEEKPTQNNKDPMAKQQTVEGKQAQAKILFFGDSIQVEKMVTLSA